MDGKYTITFIWDGEAHVWVATSEDVAGLVLEHASFDALLEKVFIAVPELLEMEERLHGDISIDCVASRSELIHAYG